VNFPRAMPLLCIGLAATLEGCAGHGAYTGDFKEKAQARMAGIKSATTWDLAHQQFEAGDLEHALKNVDQSILLNPQIARSHLLRARILIELGRLEPALESIERALDLDPDNAENHYYHAIVLERFDQPSEAFDAYRRAADLDPSNSQYIVAAAEMLIEMDRLDEASALLEGVRNESRYSSGIRQTLGHIAMMEGDPARAVSLFAEACVLSPDDPSLVEDLARAQLAGGDFADADRSLQRLRALPEYKDRRDLMHTHARCLLELDRPVEARAILTQLTDSPEGRSDIEAWVQLAECAVILEDDRALQSAASRLLALAPQRYEGYLFLAVAQRREGRLDDAVASLDRAIARAPGNALPPRLQGMIYHQLGRTEDARRALALAAAADPSDTATTRLLDRLSENR